MNILISSAAAKIQLIEHFQEAVHPSGGRVVVADMDPDCCARYFADAFVETPECGNTDFRSVILDACRHYNISMIIPTRDGELAVYADMRGELEALGVALPLPAQDALAQCQDKVAFHDFCTSHGFPVLPRLDPADDKSYPLFARARTGAGSRSAFAIPDRAAYDCLALCPDDFLFQSQVTAPEYSCDVLSDFKGKALQAVVRERQKLVRGESWRSRIVDLPEASALAMELCDELGLRGHNLVQMFLSDDVGLQLIEVNPRFGGCSSLSIKGGLQSPRRMVQMLAGEEGEARRNDEVFIGLTSIRYTRDIFIEG